MSYFPNVEAIKYEGKDTNNKFAFRHYNPEEIILGKTMKEHLRFAVAYWHTMNVEGVDQFGSETFKREWTGKTPMETAKNKVEAFFEILTKLDVEYFCFHDVDIAPQGNSLKEFFDNLDEITDLIKEKMDETGIKLLWNTANMFSHPRFLNGAGTSNDANVYAIAAAQVKKGLDLSKKLGGANYVFWGGREGYESLINTNMELELDNIAKLFQMAVDYANEIDHKPQFLLEPKPKEPMTHQYDYDAATTIAFLQKYNLLGDFKLNLEGNHATLAGHTFEHELRVARTYNALGSMDANHDEKILGWDTDEFSHDVLNTTLAMFEVLENGGIAPGGINFDAKLRRTSVDKEDIFLGHILGMDTFARALKGAAKIKEDKYLENIVSERYKSYTEGIGKRIVEGQENLSSLSEYALDNDSVEIKSNHIEYIKGRINDYLV